MDEGELETRLINPTVPVCGGWLSSTTSGSTATIFSVSVPTVLKDVVLGKARA